jgi:hypothetical protein
MGGFEVQVGLVGGTLVLAIAAARAWTARTAHLNLTFFRPYRGDPWPIGVQEDDDFQWNWTPAPAALTAARSVGESDESGSVEDAMGASIAVERTGRISVRRSGH